MSFITLLSAIGFPLLMAVGGVMAWRLSKRESAPGAEAANWRDDSLDDWRKERDAEIEQEREARVTQTSSRTHAGSGGEENEKKRIQRIGG